MAKVLSGNEMCCCVLQRPALANSETVEFCSRNVLSYVESAALPYAFGGTAPSRISKTRSPE